MPLGTSYENQTCSIASTLGLIGERWTLLIVRDAMFGLRRFDEFQANLGVARNILQTRLERLVDHGILAKHRYLEHPARYEYRLTDKGLDLWPTVVALMQWGDAHALPESGPPVLLEHHGCGGAVDAHRTCATCGKRLGPREVRAHPGPGAADDHPLRRFTERREAEAARR